MTIRTVDEELVGLRDARDILAGHLMGQQANQVQAGIILIEQLLNRVERLEDALRCLLDRFIETEVEQGRDPKKQSEVILARAALTGEHNG